MLQKGRKIREAKDQVQGKKAKNSHTDAAVHRDNINPTIQSAAQYCVEYNRWDEHASVSQYSVQAISFTSLLCLLTVPD